ncbi:hypothetical protein GGH12_000593 [Coemansia sp. RSA 1822]|nr:hypothetical protein LPJ76_005601 [Coemansia sp. RSA 638]KAJ2125512.1 hypothetical protein IW147_000864 [Coemansia sp. RSA 720]KAJ2544328.1 hypothetical protein GGF49_001309 [Coemansia sp. RSA 1853]KAJ2566817.1 hypothetical protein GGH12_000593 [Coemansia sp. RSA 1822]KAJ2666835.1 hypothetical protein IW148_000560 [Coemansia sp. RSA 1199]
MYFSKVALVALPALALADIDDIIAGAGSVFNDVTDGAANIGDKITSGAVDAFSKVTDGVESGLSRVKSDFSEGNHATDSGDDTDTSSASKMISSIGAAAAALAFAQLF